MDAKSAPTGAWKTARARFPTAPTAIIFIKIRRREIRCWTRAHRRVSRIDQFFTIDTQALSRRRLPPEPSPTAAAATATRRAPESSTCSSGKHGRSPGELTSAASRRAGHQGCRSDLLENGRDLLEQERSAGDRWGGCAGRGRTARSSRPLRNRRHRQRRFDIEPDEGVSALRWADVADAADGDGVLVTMRQDEPGGRNERRPVREGRRRPRDRSGRSGPPRTRRRQEHRYCEDAGDSGALHDGNGMATTAHVEPWCGC